MYSNLRGSGCAIYISNRDICRPVSSERKRIWRRRIWLGIIYMQHDQPLFVRSYWTQLLVYVRGLEFHRGHTVFFLHARDCQQGIGGY